MPDANPLLSFLATNDAPCPVCSYNLRNLQSIKCPECGAELHLQVGSDNVRLGPWLLGIISLSLAVGFDAVVSTVVTIAALFFEHPRSPADVRVVATMLGIFLSLTTICGSGILLLIRRRRQWCLARRPTQWRIAVAIFCVVLVVHALVGAILNRLI